MKMELKKSYLKKKAGNDDNKSNENKSKLSFDTGTSVDVNSQSRQVVLSTDVTQQTHRFTVAHNVPALLKEIEELQKKSKYKY